MSLSTEKREISAACSSRAESRTGFPALAAALILLALSSLLYLGTAGRPALLEGDVDAAHALVVREMLQRHDYVIMFMDGVRYLIRPPLQFWLTGLSYRLFGQTAFSTRLPVALAVISLVLLVYEFGRRFFGIRAGFYAALVVCTSVGMFIFTRVMIPEAIYAVEFTLFFIFVPPHMDGNTGPAYRRLGRRCLCGPGRADPRSDRRDLPNRKPRAFPYGCAGLAPLEGTAPDLQRGGLPGRCRSLAYPRRDSRARVPLAVFRQREFLPRPGHARASRLRRRAAVGTGAQIVVYGDIRVAASVGFYTGRRLLLYRAAQSNLEYGARDPDAPKTFLGDADFASLWNRGPQAFLIVPDEDVPKALRVLPQNQIWQVAAGGGKTVFSNVPYEGVRLPLSAAK